MAVISFPVEPFFPSRVNGQFRFLFFPGLAVFFHKTGFTGKWIPACPVHEGGPRRGSRGEDLHLPGEQFEFFESEFSQSLHILESAAWMGGDDIIGEELFQPLFVGQPVKQLAEFKQTLFARFTHAGQDMVIAVFWSHL